MEITQKPFPSSFKLYHLLCRSASITETSWVKQKQQWQMERRDKCVIFSKMAQFKSIYSFTYNPYYSWIPYFQIHLFAKMYLPSKINTRALSMHRVMKVCCPVQTLSAEVWCSAFLSQLLQRKQVSFSWSIQCHIFHILYFLLVILPFKMASRLVLNSYPVFLSIGQLRYALWRKYMC